MNVKQQRFVTEFLRYGDKIIAYKTAYNNPSSNPDTIISAANRLLRQPEVREAIEIIQKRIRAQVEAELKKELKQELLTVQRKRELLAQIATGEAMIEQHTKGKDCNMCTILQRPNFTQMLKAIDLDSRLAGHYQKYNKGVVQPVQIQPQETVSPPLEGLGEVPERKGIFYSEIEEELHSFDLQDKVDDDDTVEDCDDAATPKQMPITTAEINTLLSFGEHKTPKKLKKLNLLE